MNQRTPPIQIEPAGFISSQTQQLLQMNQQLIVLNQQLLSQRDQALHALEQAKAFETQKNRFMACISHEIRSPLGIISGYADQIIDDELDVVACRSVATQIRGSSEFILQVINEVLDMAKLEAHALKISPAPMSICRLLTEVQQLFIHTAVKDKLKFDLNLAKDLPNLLLIDSHRLRQVLLNLCSNAFKFTESGSVELGCKIVDSSLIVSVQDSGIGMNDEQLSCIFQPFTQADASISSRFGGTGLGLYIAHQMVALMGGKLLATSAYGQGSRFEIILPMALVAVDTDQPPLVSEPTSMGNQQLVNHQLKGHVLVAEDTPDLQIIIGALLRKSGLKVTMVSNGQEAIDIFQHTKVDLIMLDIEMPIVGGLEALQTMRAFETQHGLPITPIVALTAHALKKDTTDQAQAGFDSVITKPFNRQKLLILLGRYLSARAC